MSSGEGVGVVAGRMSNGVPVTIAAAEGESEWPWTVEMASARAKMSVKNMLGSIEVRDVAEIVL